MIGVWGMMVLIQSGCTYGYVWAMREFVEESLCGSRRDLSDYHAVSNLSCTVDVPDGVPVVSLAILFYSFSSQNWLCVAKCPSKA